MGMKGHPQSNCGGAASGSGGGGWMTKNKMAILVVVVLVGIMGVMVVQKVKDRRLFNLVIKDKDRQIVSLNLLLQKERQYVKENKRKNQDLNAKLFSLRTQKVELTNKMMEMRSIIGSMKDEHRALELAIDEKQNEIKQKESEIKDLKTSRQTSPRIWSVNSNDQSNYKLNLTSKAKERGVLTGQSDQSSNGQKPNHQETINPDGKVAETVPKDHNDDVKIEMLNTTNGTLAAEENGKSLTIKGRRFFIGATESQGDKSNGQNGKGQPKARPEEGPTEVKRVKSSRTMDEDVAETEVDVNSSRIESEEDRDYKEEAEE